jgi:4'-phosphopantetheinyl transferase
LWRCRVELPGMQRLALQQCLSPLEIERANRYRVHERREEFIVARGLLRTILARLLHGDPRGLEFTFAAKGKPSLLLPESGRDISFNLSHSHGLVLIAVTLAAAVGVDVELIRDKTDHERLAERFFSPAECAALAAVPDADRQRAFFTCWTRKEAFLKATGMGITTALDSFDVAFWPPGDARLLATRWDSNEASRWSMHNINPGGEHVASIAVEGQATVRQWEVW